MPSSSPYNPPLVHPTEDALYQDLNGARTLFHAYKALVTVVTSLHVMKLSIYLAITILFGASHNMNCLDKSVYHHLLHMT